MFQLSGLGLQRTVLACLLLHVQIDIAILVTHGFVVNGCESHAHLFADAGYQIGGLVDEGILKCQLQMLQGSIVIILCQVARGQRTVGTRYLIHIAKIIEETTCRQHQLYGQPLLWHRYRIQVFKSW